jgi:hypothetical protein
MYRHRETVRGQAFKECEGRYETCRFIVLLIIIISYTYLTSTVARAFNGIFYFSLMLSSILSITLISNAFFSFFFLNSNHFIFTQNKIITIYERGVREFYGAI